MLAIRRHQLGVAVAESVPVPQPAADEVLVRMLHAAVNPFDLQVLAGDVGADVDRPLTLGAEGVGLLDGQPVQVSGDGLGSRRDGTFAQWVAVPATAARPVPAGVDLRAIATVGVAGKAAWRAVRQLAQVQPGDVVLVLGAAGGVGMFATQLATASGAQVIAQTGDLTKVGQLAAIGARPVVAGSGQDLAPLVERDQVTVVLDPLGGDFVAALLPVLAPSARVVTYGTLAGREALFDLRLLYGKGIHVLGTSGAATSRRESAAALTGVAEAVRTGAVVVGVESLQLGEALEGFDRLRARSVVGKLVLDV